MNMNRRPIRPVSPAEVEEVRRLHSLGYSNGRIGRALDRSPVVVAHHLGRMGLRTNLPRSAGIPRRLYGHQRSLEAVGERVDGRLHAAGGWTARCLCGWSQHERISKSAAAAYQEHLRAEASKPRKCVSCKGTKPQDEMALHSPHLCKKCLSDKVRDWAKDNPEAYEAARRKSLLKKRYGLSVEQYEALVAASDGLCAICGKEPRDSRGFHPHIDHCHRTGRVRGILCGPCNRGIGQFRDDPDVMEKAIQYLRRHEEAA